MNSRFIVDNSIQTTCMNSTLIQSKYEIILYYIILMSYNYYTITKQIIYTLYQRLIYKDCANIASISARLLLTEFLSAHSLSAHTHMLVRFENYIDVS